MAEETKEPKESTGSTQSNQQKRGTMKCTVESCKRPYRAKGFCNVHYRLWRHGEMPLKARYKICTKEACRKPRLAQGSLCAEHAGGETATA